MGQPAARATIDVSAHSGPIQSGSPDVIIGGFPAARKGDTLSCSTHGSGIIVGAPVLSSLTVCHLHVKETRRSVMLAAHWHLPYRKQQHLNIGGHAGEKCRRRWDDARRTF
ncbi:PAAR domain-containing protein [Enterobacter hormaechei]